jgi:hypothetical protein
MGTLNDSQAEFRRHVPNTLSRRQRWGETAMSGDLYGILGRSYRIRQFDGIRTRDGYERHSHRIDRAMPEPLRLLIDLLCPHLVREHTDGPHGWFEIMPGQLPEILPRLFLQYGDQFKGDYTDALNFVWHLPTGGTRDIPVLVRGQLGWGPILATFPGHVSTTHRRRKHANQARD